MESHFDYTDSEFLLSMESLKFPAQIFTHIAHLRLGWLLIKKHGLKFGIIHMEQLLKAYTKKNSAEDKFNKTLTVASMQAVNHFINRSQYSSFEDLIIEFPRLRTSFKDLLLTHYSKEILLSQTAKKTYLEPDLLPF